MQLKRSSQSGFTLVEILIVVAIIGLLAAIALPNFIRARESSQKNACIENLTQIDGAKHTWAIEQKKVSTDLPTAADLYGPTLYIREEPTCPASTSPYTINQVDTKPTCPIGSNHTI